MPLTRSGRLLAAGAALLLPGCSGTSCDALPVLRAERDAARSAYAALLQTGTAGPDETERADAGVHVLDARVHALEQEC